MPAVDGHQPGMPSWTDLGTPDVDAAAAFYFRLFDWENRAAGPPELTGGYRFFFKHGRLVAGFGPLVQEGQPPAWTVYIAVDDADANARLAREHGGIVHVEPMAVMDAGRLAIIEDPSGAVFGTWEPGRHKGAELVNEPGAFCWAEVVTRDPGAAKAFYAGVFGWTPEDNPMGGAPYTVFRLGEANAAGLVAMDDGWPGDMPPHWQVYFAVEDCDATIARLDELGGTTLHGPVDLDIGRFAIVTDPFGALFGVIALAQAPEAARQRVPPGTATPDS
jgi:predicted enzyme related to lactoylglutathione lyase